MSKRRNEGELPTMTTELKLDDVSGAGFNDTGSVGLEINERDQNRGISIQHGEFRCEGLNFCRPSS